MYSLLGWSVTLKAKFAVENKEIETEIDPYHYENKRLDYKEFEALLMSNDDNKYNILKKELDYQKDIPLQQSAILK